METATAVAELRPAVESLASVGAAQATVVAGLAHNVGEAGFAVESIDAHIAIAVAVGVSVLVFDRVFGMLWSRLRRAAGLEG